MVVKAESRPWSERAIKLFQERYLHTKDDGTQETPEEMCWRVAYALASVEQKWSLLSITVQDVATHFYNMMVRQEFFPNSPCMANAGRPLEWKKNLAACIVLPIEDSLESIYNTLRRAALRHSDGSGTGFDFSSLREEGCATKGSTASGPISFLRLYDASTQVIKQAGQRRGANMGVLWCDHPDIEQFITCKTPSIENPNPVSNFNISVGITNAFVHAVLEDTEWQLISPKTKQVTKTLRARDLFESMVCSAWATGDPGLLFFDRINNSSSNPIPELTKIVATNPCGEQALENNGVCNLGSINLGHFVQEGVVNWVDLEQTIRWSVRLLDNMVELNPIDDVDVLKQNLNLRRIGLGPMGWADMLVKLGIEYASNKALELATTLANFMTKIGIHESEQLATVRGGFPLQSQSIYRNDKPRRNSCITNIAPTGTISFFANCSSGIEPYFGLCFTHNNQLGRTMYVYNELFSQTTDYLYQSGANPKNEINDLMEKVKRDGILGNKENGNYCFREDKFSKLNRIFATAQEIPWKWHVNMLEAWQMGIQNSISKTINMANSATTDDVHAVYLQALESYVIKGITIYRDGCKSTGQVLNLGSIEPDVVNTPTETTMIARRPKSLEANTIQIQTPHGKGYVIVSHDGEMEDSEPLEVFVTIGKAGSDVQSFTESLGRVISTALRMPSSLSRRDRLNEIAEQLTGIGGSSSIGMGPTRVLSVPDAIGKSLTQWLWESLGVPDEEYTEVKVEMKELAAVHANGNGSKNGHHSGSADLCPKCRNMSLHRSEGCQTCGSCGYSKC